MSRPVCILSVPIEGGGIYGALDSCPFHPHPNLPPSRGKGSEAGPIPVLTAPLDARAIQRMGGSGIPYTLHRFRGALAADRHLLGKEHLSWQQQSIES